MSRNLTTVKCLTMYMYHNICVMVSIHIATFFVSGVQLGLSTKYMDFSSYHPRSSSLETLKPYQCTSCHATFTDKMDLKTHMSQIHGHKMPYCCQLCGKGYFSAMGLRHHKSVHEGKQFNCPVCDKKTNQKGNMKLHLRRVHKSDQCSNCLQVFPLEEFQLHVSTCLR